jgi:hypothetical protein
MTWLKRILVALGVVLVLIVAILSATGLLGPSGPAEQSKSMTVGNRTISINGHYKELTQETMADGMKVVVDGHVITATPGELTIDGKTHDIDPSQDVEINVNDKGELAVKVLSSEGAAHEKSPVN